MEERGKDGTGRSRKNAVHATRREGGVRERARVVQQRTCAARARRTCRKSTGRVRNVACAWCWSAAADCSREPGARKPAYTAHVVPFASLSHRARSACPHVASPQRRTLTRPRLRLEAASSAALCAPWKFAPCYAGIRARRRMRDAARYALRAMNLTVQAQEVGGRVIRFDGVVVMLSRHPPLSSYATMLI